MTTDPMFEMAEAAKAGITVDQYRARKARERRRMDVVRSAIEATHEAFRIGGDEPNEAPDEGEEW